MYLHGSKCRNLSIVNLSTYKFGNQNIKSTKWSLNIVKTYSSIRLDQQELLQNNLYNTKSKYSGSHLGWD